MSFTEAILAGIIQGLTEFLPVSSSGHLVLLHSIFGFSSTNVFFDIFLHLATVFAVIFFLKTEILELLRKGEYAWLLYLVAATIPAVIAGLMFGEFIEGLFQNPGTVAYLLLFTGVLLMLGHIKLKKHAEEKKLTLKSALVMGFFQMIALLPGISRSGGTVTAGILAGLKKEDAYKFSFLMAIPVILGTVVFKIVSSGGATFAFGEILTYAAGMISAFFVGFLSLKIFWLVIKREKLIFFSIYCFAVGGVVLLFWR